MLLCSGVVAPAAWFLVWVPMRISHTKFFAARAKPFGIFDVESLLA
jgi:hypothetical protein